MELYGKVFGEVRVVVMGAFPESLVNSSAKADIELKRLRYIDSNTISAIVSERDYAEFEMLCAKCMCELLETETYGGSRNRVLAVRRKWLAFFLAAAFSLFLLSSMFVWEIDVRGNETLSKGEVLRALSDAGVDTGCFWPGISSELVKNKVMESLPEIGWMALNVSGSRAIAVIMERTEKPEIYTEKAASNIIAEKTGIIKKLSVLNGKAAAAPGDAVTAGEILVSGAMDSSVNGTRYVCARAAVTADTWYELTAVSPEREDLKESAKFSRHRFAVVLGKRRINLYFFSGKTIDEYDKIICEYKLGVKGLFSLPVSLVHEKLRHYKMTPGYAVDTAEMENRLNENLRSRVAGEICSKSFSEAISNGVYVLTLRAHCTEEIGKTIPLF